MKVTLFLLSIYLAVALGFDRENNRIKGHMAALFTPFRFDGSLDLDALPPMAERLNEWGIQNVMVSGTTGESVSLTLAERKFLANEWITNLAPKYNLSVYIHVGANSLQEAQEIVTYSTHLTDTNGHLKGFLAMSPNYFKPTTPEQLADSMAMIASQAPDLPFWYYHFPANTGVNFFTMEAFLKAVEKKQNIPNLMGIKFTDEHIMDFVLCAQLAGGKYNMLFGRDEILLSALVTGVCEGDVGSTLNYMTFNLDVRKAYEMGDLKTAQEFQSKTVDVIDTFSDYSGLSIQKDILALTGIEYGPMRLPQVGLDGDQRKDLAEVLKDKGMNITAY